ncbi:TrkA family protein [Sulfuritortus calidifontis]|uniref:TrkA family protein n=1 Tax=Sulfuritortus calidifontis TaxID=1914471 RepID=A0A4R3JXI9_9PROT|nr:NAD-binding protein [Sulfuritortus calidifontis]TCS71460.1 TrkA family protein [Sulfuritortus calidifontis]
MLAWLALLPVKMLLTWPAPAAGRPGAFGCLTRSAALPAPPQEEEDESRRRAGLPVHYGDASRINTLRAAGVERARLVVITFHRPEQALRIAHWLRHTHPKSRCSPPA